MEKKVINLNIACGDQITLNKNWINLDYEANNKIVVKCDLINNIPFEKNTVSNIYLSHFIEHISLDKVDYFLNNCFNILETHGKIRIVTPDFYEMSSSFVKAYENKNYDIAELIKIEILDQLVRSKEGGRLRLIIKKYVKNNDEEMLNIIKNRFGKDLITNNKNNIAKKNYFKIIRNKLIKSYIFFVLKFLPNSFKNQNISFTKVGENHKWLWDFDDLKKRLEINGFKNVLKKKFNESDIKDFPYDLDVKNNLPRKGIQSMYIEAEKK